MTDNLTAARQLIKAFAGISSTDDLIFYVAGTDHMLALCQLLLEQYEQDGSSPLAREVDRLCAEHGVLAGAFYAEARKVLLALNRFHDADRDHYAILGLQPNASMEEVKKAYRQLSKKHHPDTSRDSAQDAKHFMEIAGAYHAIMASPSADGTRSATPWRRPPKSSPGNRLRDRFFFIIIVVTLICLLTIASVYISGRHSRMVMVSQWQSKTAAMGQPETGTGKKEALTILPESLAREPRMPETTAGPLTDHLSIRDDAEHQQPDMQPTDQTPDPVLSARAFPGRESPTPEPPAQTTVNRETPHEKMPAALPLIMQPPPEIKAPPAGNTAALTPRMPEKESPAPAPAKDLQEKQDRIGKINTTLEINTLIKQYTTLYSDRELSPFLDLFADQAEENGRPLTGLTEKYQSLFARARAIDLKINDINWNEHISGYRVRGSFLASYAYKNGGTGDYQGHITFYMVREEDRLKIKSLEYTFDE